MFGLTTNRKATAEAPDLKQHVQDAIAVYFAELAQKCKPLDILQGITEDGPQLAKCVEDFAVEKAKFNLLAAAADQIKNLVDAKFKEMSEKLAENMHELEQALKDGCIDEDGEPDAALFSDKKSIDFAYGTIGFRASSELQLDLDKECDSTLALLKKLPKNKRELYVKTVESVDKPALKKQNPEFLSSVNAKMNEKQNFYVKPNTVVF